MDEPPLPPAARPRGRPALPLAVPLALAAAVWAAGLLSGTARQHPRPHIRSGSVPELAEQVRAAPRAMVYVCPEYSSWGLAGRPAFREAAERLAREHPGLGVQFFVVGYWNGTDRAWVESFRDGRLAYGLGYARYGWVMWPESGRLRDVDFYVTEYPAPGVEGSRTVGRTHSLWPR